MRARCAPRTVLIALAERSPSPQPKTKGGGGQSRRPLSPRWAQPGGGHPSSVAPNSAVLPSTPAPPPYTAVTDAPRLGPAVQRSQRARAAAPRTSRACTGTSCRIPADGRRGRGDGGGGRAPGVGGVPRGGAGRGGQRLALGTGERRPAT